MSGPTVTVLAVGLALLAAALFAMASVAQRGAASEIPDAEASGVRLMARLVRSPQWWAGTVGDTGGFVVQAAALGFGSLLLVQPLLVTTLLFALPLEAMRRRRPVGRRDLAWALVLAACLAVFVVVGEPTAGIDRAPLHRWLPVGSVLLILLVGCVVLAGRRDGRRRALFLAIATGLAYGLTAAMMISVVRLLDDGPLAVLTGWETYVLVAAAVGGTWLQQSAYQAGDLAASLPAVTVGEPVIGAVLGVLVLGEQVRADGPEWVLIGVLVVVMVVATLALARSSSEITIASTDADPAPAGGSRTS